MIVQNDLKFFTNEPQRDLYSRFTTILKSNTQFFDVLVGYFRTSGFFMLYPALENVEKIRILVGLNVDPFTIKVIDRMNDKVAYSSFTRDEEKGILEQNIEKEFENASTTPEVEKGVRIFIDWLKSGKMELRLYTKSPIHAKVYIMRKDPNKVPDMYGSIITGSSNFSEAGLVDNIEFNVELKDAPDVRFALDKFEKLWQESEDIKDTYIETVQCSTWMKDDITPYELYLKTLYEFFKEEINADKNNFQALLPEGYMRLQYQIDAVTQARQKLNAYGGVFISDVVGLGKTYICAMLANTFNRNTYKLFICPPVLVDYWKSVLQEFDVSRADVVSLGKLDSVLERGTDKYGYIFIDEAHRFRNSGTESFTKLHQICRSKKVVLISATPINNYTRDIENQIYLFQPKHNGTINGIRNIEGFFQSLNRELNKLEKGSQRYMDKLHAISETIRDKLLREIMIRRTRSEIEKYYAADLEAQGLSFPKAGSPEKIIYSFDNSINQIFEETMATIKAFKYSRYTPLLYLKSESKKKYAQMLVAQSNMGGFMKGILVKRLESSFFAFCKTVARFIDSYERFINMVESKQGKVYISKKVNVYDLLDDGNTDKLLTLIEQQDIIEFDKNDFKAEFLTDLRQDLSQLQKMLNLWKGVTVDPKLSEFKKNLSQNPIMKDKKIIVFTESKETAEYLCKNLKDTYRDSVVFFSGQSSQSLRVDIENSFNPERANSGGDKYRLLITTDVLAEGINLHRASVVVNYDLPWNPTRIMQRVGRINRVGTTFAKIYVFNFFPTAQSEKQLPLEERIMEKLQTFHDTLGEDFKYLSDAEDVSPKKLFRDLTKEIDSDEGGTNPELKYLTIIRNIRDNEPALFAKIKKLPRKARAGKISDMTSENTTISFIRKGALKTFFRTDNETKQLSFMNAVRFIQSETTDNKLTLESDYYDQFKKNSDAFDDWLTDEDVVTTEKVKVSGNDAKIVRMLKSMRDEASLDEDQKEKINILIKRWESGEIPSQISKDVVKRVNKANNLLCLYHEILEIIPVTYLEDSKYQQSKVEGEKQIILSCYLKAQESK